MISCQCQDIWALSTSLVLQFAIGLLSDSGIDHSIIEQNYLPTFQDIQMIRTLHRLSIPANDWIIVADTDEFFTYGFSTVQEAVMDMDQEGATFAMGEMLDHVARDGQLHKLKVFSLLHYRQ